LGDFTKKKMGEMILSPKWNFDIQLPGKFLLRDKYKLLPVVFLTYEYIGKVSLTGFLNAPKNTPILCLLSGASIDFKFTSALMS